MSVLFHIVMTLQIIMGYFVFSPSDHMDTISL